MTSLINRVRCRFRSMYPIVLAFLVVNAAHAMEPDQVNVLDSNRNTVTQYFEEVWNQGKLNVLDELLSPEYINHSPDFENPKPGPDGLKPIISAIRKGFPN